MLAVIGCLALIVLVLAGIGALIGARHRPGEITFGAYVIRGLVPVTAIGLIANFLIPLTHEVALATVALGLAAAAFKHRQIWLSLGSRPVLMLGAVMALLVAFAAGAVITPMAYDTGLYHLQAIEWLEQSTKVFGLANLHLRFGVISTWFTTAAMLDLPGIGRRDVFLLNPMLLLAVLAAMLQPAIEWRPTAGPQRMSNIVAIILAVVLMANAKLLSFHAIGASPSYDLPSALLLFLACWAFIKAHETDGVGTTSAVQADFVLVLAASVLAVAVKLSAMPILLLLPAALLSLRKSRVSLAPLLCDPVVVLVALVGVMWLATGVVTSGCLVFPASATCLHGLPWSVPAEQVSYTADTVAAWARMPGDRFLAAVHGWAWLKSWPFTVLAHRAFLAGTGATLAMMALLVAALTIRGRRAGVTAAAPIRSVRVVFAVAYAAATGGTGLVFWFLTAPDPRFGIGFLIVTPALLLAWAAGRWLPEEGLAQRAWNGNTVAALVFLFAAVFVAIFGLSAVAAANSWPEIPAPVVQDEMLGPGFHANVPVGTDQCWDAPLPCAPDFHSPSLHDGHVLMWRAIESGATGR